ncbi:4-alpha-glucanotransferase (amylomaltase) [Chitinispirillum alkaliphilum]|nr:4-alpha-glucanotransferase (amylomaltase) [Chitinispirillum alkaliphilum]
MKKRNCGVLLHLTSLPSKYGCGDFGQPAFSFIKTLSQSAQNFWQLLPLNPLLALNSFSPYSSFSSNAISSLFLSPENLYELQLADRNDLTPFNTNSPQTNYQRVSLFKDHLLEKAWKRMERKLPSHTGFTLFCEKNRYWLDDYALFIALKISNNHAPWYEWPQPLKLRNPKALQSAKLRYEEIIQKTKFTQFLLDSQLENLREFAHSHNVHLIGDLPFYQNCDSVEAWTQPFCFKLNENLTPAFLSGMPPDIYSPLGQRWRNPVYNWDQLKRCNYKIWKNRLRRMFSLYDMIRLDHFRGFVSYWQIDATLGDARKGTWVDVDTDHFLGEMARHFPTFPVFVEDLGASNAKVREVVSSFNLPGSRVLQFGFDPFSPNNIHLPHNYPHNCVASTSTHDTNTIIGWFRAADTEQKNKVLDYVGESHSLKGLHTKLIRSVMISQADTVIIPFQDILGLGEEGRINHPGSGSNNWSWRYSAERIEHSVFKDIARMSEIYDRV